MRKIDYNLPHTHPHNIETARLLGLVWSERDHLYVSAADGSIPAGYEGEFDSIWGRLSRSDKVYAHK
jgi:hypothetical protein